MKKTLRKIVLFHFFSLIFLVAVAISFGQTANMQRDNWVVEGEARLKKEEIKKSQDFRDISSKDERAMFCLFSRNSCIKKCGKIFKEPKKNSEKTKELQTLFIKRKCVLTCNWNRDICNEQF